MVKPRTKLSQGSFRYHQAASTPHPKPHPQTAGIVRISLGSPNPQPQTPNLRLNGQTPMVKPRTPLSQGSFGYHRAAQKERDVYEKLAGGAMGVVSRYQTPE